MELKIENISQKLFEEVLRTLPSQPEYVKRIVMVAEGISTPGHNEEGGEERYLSECAENNVSPHSIMSLAYNDQFKFFVPEGEEGIVGKITEGGRIYKWRIIIKPPSVEIGFQKFKDHILGTMLDNGYQLDNGELWLDMYRISYLRFGREPLVRGLELHLNERHTPEDVQRQVTEWFNKLQERYQQ